MRAGAGAAREWPGMRSEPRTGVRSTLPEAAAVVPALVRTPVRRVMRKPVRGEAGTGEACGATARAATSAVRSARASMRR